MDTRMRSSSRYANLSSIMPARSGALSKLGSRHESRASVRFERTDQEKLSVFSSASQPVRPRVLLTSFGGHPRTVRKILLFRAFPAAGHSEHFRVLTSGS